MRGGEVTTSDIQKKAIDHGFKYWRAPDAHGVDGTVQQAIRLLQDLIGVEVGIGGDEDRGCPECHGMSEAIGKLSIEAMRDHATIRRLRISQLRRMAEASRRRFNAMPFLSLARDERWSRFYRACLAEIAQLQGEG
jgi:hypothetical protein